MTSSLNEIPIEYWKSKEDLIKSLSRWVEIADRMSESGDWDKCSLLHSFSNILSLDIQQAIKIIEKSK